MFLIRDPQHFRDRAFLSFFRFFCFSFFLAPGKIDPRARCDEMNDDVRDSENLDVFFSYTADCSSTETGGEYHPSSRFELDRRSTERSKPYSTIQKVLRNNSISHSTVEVDS